MCEVVEECVDDFCARERGQRRAGYLWTARLTKTLLRGDPMTTQATSDTVTWDEEMTYILPCAFPITVFQYTFIALSISLTNADASTSSASVSGSVVPLGMCGANAWCWCSPVIVRNCGGVRRCLAYLEEGVPRSRVRCRLCRRNMNEMQGTA